MTVQVCRTVSEFRSECDRLRREGHTLGLVPTMGALHAAHEALVRLAGEHATRVAVTLFVNPTQFGPEEDLDRYPRDLTAMCNGARRRGQPWCLRHRPPSRGFQRDMREATPVGASPERLPVSGHGVNRHERHVAALGFEGDVIVRRLEIGV